MFKSGTVVKVLLPNVVNSGYDYRLTVDADLGSFVRVTLMNRPYIGVIYGVGDGQVSPEKIKNITKVFSSKLSVSDLQWISKMSEWTLMTPGAVLKLIVNVPDAFDEPRTEQLYVCNTEHNETKITENRQMVLDAFDLNDNEPMSVSDIQNISHVSPSVIKTMIARNMLIPTASRHIVKSFAYDYKDVGNIELNAEQSAAANKIGTDIMRGGFSVNLLDGITGSGKTQVYFDSVWRAYSAGKSVLLMMPEIALTAQFMQRFKSRFGAPPVVWHSNLTAARRRDIWRGVLSGEIRMLVGTRSALFLPWQNLGLIVVDEEHDSSYKQEDMGNYHGRDMAILRGKLSNFPVVLASATPSEETMHNVELGRYGHIVLKSRYGGAELPTIQTIDLREHKPIDYHIDSEKEEMRTGALSQVLCDEIAATLAKHQQVMLFINRRGFAPIVQCKKCGWVATCQDCSVSMTYHKNLGKLLCHICGRTMALPDKCPSCHNEVSMRGTGLEKVEEEIHAKFPHARTALVSSDTMMSRGALERLVSKMESGELDIVIGTQILAKGHHFPNLTLVGVVDSDIGLFGTDFRSAEHTFQQLFQVAGRAGRGKVAGRVLLQTYQPNHPVLVAICAGNRDEFLRTDMDARRGAKMPPFGQLISVIIEAKKESVLKQFCNDLATNAPNVNGAKIMGPVMAQLYQVRGWFRMRFLVAGDERAALQPTVKKWLERVRVPYNVRVKIDVNPQNFM
ncbi:MAG: primosomal protein N' [Alphaproteobacteria bacterium]|nr:primosomal protein N' [Alphaproteobacteria bacterium]